MSSNLDFWCTDNSSGWQDDTDSSKLHDSLFESSTAEKIMPKGNRKRKKKTNQTHPAEPEDVAESEKVESMTSSIAEAGHGRKRKKKDKRGSVSEHQISPQTESSTRPQTQMPNSSSSSSDHSPLMNGNDKKLPEQGDVRKQIGEEKETKIRTRNKRKRKANKNKFKPASSLKDTGNVEDVDSKDGTVGQEQASQNEKTSTTRTMEKLSKKERRKLKRKIARQEKSSINKQNAKSILEANQKAKHCETSPPLQQNHHLESKQDPSSPDGEEEDEDDDGNGERLILVNSKRTSSKSKPTPGASLKTQMESQLKSSQFRFLNEKLYKVPGESAKNLFANDKDAFLTYHQGFTQQVERWPINPVDTIIEALKKRPANHIVGDFGCGDAKIARSVKMKVQSFDLYAINKHVTVCDVAKVPLADEVLDVAVFCLSLMGTNWMEYLQEANRVLKSGGLLKVAEVASRFTSAPAFLSTMKHMGFMLKHKDVSNKMFYLFDFKKKQRVTTLPSAKADILKPCLYKKR